ncbi:PEP-CTERM sorting domain-containing protein [Gloeocapsa sp. PCC 73106]|uniref:PEP-CTERM sorting domain-containing protein n=1 Tax=Gloeocapsa sp. PCC 73106 TaxID=102232 RepID=UPI0002AC16E9|nr:PEP-CTERM sorting domain-containing protein [Gloeocapsa sp. PCC 73106]ELR98139.1 secreted trypsin-like serine protease [Gloeocapsa sp. PCC 73106]
MLRKISWLSVLMIFWTVTPAVAKPLDLTLAGRENYVRRGVFRLRTGPFINQEAEYTAAPFYTTAGPPRNYVVNPPSEFDSVADLTLNVNNTPAFGCSGALVGDNWVLTAAHCLTDNEGRLEVDGGTVSFDTANGTESLNISDVYPHPDWDGDFFRGNDIALLRTTTEASANLTRYSIFTGNTDNILEEISDKVGYGRSGHGRRGSVLNGGTKRAGENIYDAYSDTLLTGIGETPGVDFIPRAFLGYDFDNGTEANDAYGFFFNIDDLGLGAREVSAAPGDSGGPTFVNNQIVGVTSWGIRLSLNNGATSDVNRQINSSFGEFTFDTNVSLYQNWVNSYLQGNVLTTFNDEQIVPEPMTILGTGLVFLFMPLLKKHRI